MTTGGNDILYGDSDSGDVITGGDDTFVFDTDTSFDDDTVRDAGAGGTQDTLRFTGVADGDGDDFADLDAIATYTEVAGNVIVSIGTDSVTITGIGTGAINSAAALDATAQVTIEVVHP